MLSKIRCPQEPTQERVETIASYIAYVLFLFFCAAVIVAGVCIWKFVGAVQTV